MRIPLARDEIEFIDDGKKVELGNDEMDKGDQDDLDNVCRHNPSSKRKVKRQQIRPTTAVQGIN